MRKKLFLAMATTLIAVGIFLGASEIGVRLVTKISSETGVPIIGGVALLRYQPSAEAAREASEAAVTSTYVIRDQELGWVFKPNGKAGEYCATSPGFRRPKNWATTISVSRGKIRTSVYGDSFTHGDGVPLKGT